MNSRGRQRVERQEVRECVDLHRTHRKRYAKKYEQNPTPTNWWLRETDNTELCYSRLREERKEARKAAVTWEEREMEWSVRGLEARLTATHRVVRVVASRSRV